MRATAEVVQLQKKEEAKFMCSACGSDRGCNCNAPAVEKLAEKIEQDRQRAKAYRERKKAQEKQQVRHVTPEQPNEPELLVRARQRIDTLGPPWQLQEPTGRERNYIVIEPDNWNGKCGPHIILCRDISLVHEELDKIEEIEGAEGERRDTSAATHGHSDDTLLEALDEAVKAARELKKRQLNGDLASFFLFCLGEHVKAIERVGRAIEKKYREQLRLFQEAVAAEKEGGSSTETVTVEVEEPPKLALLPDNEVVEIPQPKKTIELDLKQNDEPDRTVKLNITHAEDLSIPDFMKRH